MKLFVLLFVWGPAMSGFALGWLVRHPDDWTGPAVIAPIGVALTVLTYRQGLRRRATLVGEHRLLVTGAMVASALIGVCIFAMLVLGMIG